MYAAEGPVLGARGANPIARDGVVLGASFGASTVPSFGFSELDMKMTCDNTCFVKDWSKESGCDLKPKVAQKTSCA